MFNCYDIYFYKDKYLKMYKYVKYKSLKLCIILIFSL